jgi:glycosyltransferase involved in cell wall biosynthesis
MEIVYSDGAISMKPNVAVIVANYNYGEYVIEAINSALNQRYDGSVKVFVVNDGSTDDSWTKILDYAYKNSNDLKLENKNFESSYYNGKYESIESDRFKFININNSGASVARNVAIWEAWEWADIFGILDADDEYKPEKIEKLVNVLMEHDEIGVAYADYDIVKDYADLKYTSHEFKQSYSKEKLLNSCVVHSGSLVKKNYLEKVILTNKEIFDSRLHGPGSGEFIGCTEDYDLWLRLSNHCIMCHVPESLSVVRESGKNQSMKMTSETFQQNAKILSSRVL